jgi:hypothetical protein
LARNKRGSPKGLPLFLRAERLETEGGKKIEVKNPKH